MVQSRTAALHRSWHELDRCSAKQKVPCVSCSTIAQILLPASLFEAKCATTAQPVWHQLYSALHCCRCRCVTGFATFSFLFSSLLFSSLFSFLFFCWFATFSFLFLSFPFLPFPFLSFPFLFLFLSFLSFLFFQLNPRHPYCCTVNDVVYTKYCLVVPKVWTIQGKSKVNSMSCVMQMFQLVPLSQTG